MTRHRAERKVKGYRLSFDENLARALAETFVMTNMRELERQLRAASGDTANVEKDIPFWEFLDIEFDGEKKTKKFYLTAHYTQQPSFPALFKRMIGSPTLLTVS